MIDTQEYIYYDAAYVPSSFGMHNTGVICWCNSLIQVLLGMSSMNQILLESENELQNNAFAREYINLLKHTLPHGSPSVSDNFDLANASSLILSAFKKQLKIRNFTLNMGDSQECCDEAFTLFVDMFGCPKLEKLFSNVYEMIIVCNNCSQKVSAIRDKSYRIQLFTKVELKNQNKFCTYLRVHPSECDYYKCDCGGIMTKFYRTERLKMLREIVILIFNKYQNKDNRWFPSELVFDSKSGQQKLKYKIVGKIEHSGNYQSGHYWAQSLRNDDWQCLNDSSVAPGNELPTTSTFMVAYHLYQ